MTEVITIKHNRGWLEAWHGQHLVIEADSPFLLALISPVMSYASSFDPLKIVYKRPSGPNGETSDTTLYQRNTRMNFAAGAQQWVDWRPTSSHASA